MNACGRGRCALDDSRCPWLRRDRQRDSRGGRCSAAPRRPVPADLRLMLFCRPNSKRVVVQRSGDRPSIPGILDADPHQPTRHVRRSGLVEDAVIRDDVHVRGESEVIHELHGVGPPAQVAPATDARPPTGRSDRATHRFGSEHGAARGERSRTAGSTSSWVSARPRPRSRASSGGSSSSNASASSASSIATSKSSATPDAAVACTARDMMLASSDRGCRGSSPVRRACCRLRSSLSAVPCRHPHRTAVSPDGRAREGCVRSGLPTPAAQPGGCRRHGTRASGERSAPQRRVGIDCLTVSYHDSAWTGGRAVDVRERRSRSRRVEPAGRGVTMGGPSVEPPQRRTGVYGLLIPGRSARSGPPPERCPRGARSDPRAR